MERKRLVEDLKRQGYVHSKSVEKALLSISREHFVPENKKQVAYIDRPLDIWNNQTISAPHMVAIMTEAMNLILGQRVLEIGTGSGYHAAVVSKMIGNNGHLYSIERFEKLAERARQHLQEEGIDNVTVIVGDGSLGLEEHAPYDCIYVTCSAPTIPPPLKDQIRIGGRIVIPVGRVVGELLILMRTKNGFQKKSYGGCAFVPLIGKYGFEY